MKATAVAPSNIAFIKYWGKKDEKLRLPANGSISVNLSGLKTITTVEFSDKYKIDDILINGEKRGKEVGRVMKQLDRIKKIAKIHFKTKVISQNNFPMASGLASSASGFAALTVAATKAVGLNLSEKELTILARLGSGSACRSIPDGFVEWEEGKSHESSYARSIFPSNYWDLSIIVALVESRDKKTSSTDGHKLAETSLFFKTRLKNIDNKITTIKRLIGEKKFKEFGQLVEGEALEMHSVMLTCSPSLIYWQPTTIELMKLTQQLRKEGFPVYFTIDAGPHLFLICEKKNTSAIINKLKKIRAVKKIIINQPDEGTNLINQHLF